MVAVCKLGVIAFGWIRTIFRDESYAQSSVAIVSGWEIVMLAATIFSI